MHEVFAEILAYIQGASRYKWWAIVAAWAICISGWVFVSQMPDKYEANARVHVDTDTLLKPLLGGMVFQSDIASKVRLMSKLVFTRPNLEKVARMTDLDLNVHDEKDMEDLVDRLKSSMEIEGGKATLSNRRSSLFTISAEDKNPKLAKKMVQSVLTIFVEEVLDGSRKGPDEALRFIDQQLKDYVNRLRQAELAREEFKRKYYGLLPGEGGNVSQQMQTLAFELESARMNLQQEMKRRDEFKLQLDGLDPTFFGLDPDNPVMNPLEARIQAMQSKVDDLLLRFTKKHPDVIAAKKSIMDLEKQKATESSGSDGSDVSKADLGRNPVYQQMRVSLAESEANVASTRARVTAFESKLEQLKQQTDKRLNVETELKNLNRDYEAIKTNYEALLVRKESARLSESMEQTTDSVKFRVVDPPQVPSSPSSPNRILLSTAVFFGALVVGMGLAILLSLLRPTFSNVQKLREATGLPILGTVSMNWIPEIRQRKWKEFLRFSFAASALLVIFVGILVLEMKGLNLQSIS